MTPLAPVHVIVTERPNRVYVIFGDQIHHARWKTGNPGEKNVFDVVGNDDVCHAALCAWNGQHTFTTTFEELDKYDDYGTPSDALTPKP